MTTNQLKYWELKETERANRIKEEELHRSNVAQEQLKSEANALELEKAKRSEGLKRAELAGKYGYLVSDQYNASPSGRQEMETGTHSGYNAGNVILWEASRVLNPIGSLLSKLF